MDFLVPPIFDVPNVDMWKFRMSAYLKTLGLHVYLVTTKKTYRGNDKYIKANAQALDALKHVSFKTRKVEFLRSIFSSLNLVKLF